MAKTSVGGHDDGEVSSSNNPNQQRPRIPVAEDEPEYFEDPSGTDDEEEDDDDDDKVQESEEHEADDDDDDEEPYIEEDQHVDTIPFEPSWNGNGRETTGSATNDRAIPVMLCDPDVLDCCICYDSLSIPVFQCYNGHIACSTCCATLGNKCPLCLMATDYIRCRALEKVLQSISLSCPNATYGCEEILRYGEKNDHEKTCIYVPCLCPHSGCDFVAISNELSLHFRHEHGGSRIQFTYGDFFYVYIKFDDNAIVLQEKTDGNLFILNNNVEIRGNIVNMSCIGPNLPLFRYEILACSQGCSLILHSFAKNIRGRTVDTPSSTFLLIPSAFFDSSEHVKLEIRITYY